MRSPFQNLTDADDKIIRGAIEQEGLLKRFHGRVFRRLSSRCITFQYSRPIFVLAQRTIEAMLQMIQILIEQGWRYAVPFKGDVLFGLF